MQPVQRGRRHEIAELVRAARRPMSVREVAASTGLHSNTARFHLDALVRQGRLRREDGPAAGRGRPACRYAPVVGMDRGGPRNYQLLAEMVLSRLAGDPDPGGAALQTGAAWGRYLVQPPAPGRQLSPDESLARLTDLLAGIGFDPHAAPEPDHATRVELRHCPFLELAETQSRLVCTLHLGLMRGALDHLGTALDVESLTPFAEPGACVARVVPLAGSHA